MYRLAGALDDICDHVDEAAGRIVSYGVTEIRLQAREQAKVIRSSAGKLADAVALLEGFQDSRRHLDELRELEDVGDSILHDSVSSLFMARVDPLEVIRWKDIHESLESAVDGVDTRPTCSRPSSSRTGSAAPAWEQRCLSSWSSSASRSTSPTASTIRRTTSRRGSARARSRLAPRCSSRRRRTSPARSSPPPSRRRSARGIIDTGLATDTHPCSPRSSRGDRVEPPHLVGGPAVELDRTRSIGGLVGRRSSSRARRASDWSRDLAEGDHPRRRVSADRLRRRLRAPPSSSIGFFIASRRESRTAASVWASSCWARGSHSRTGRTTRRRRWA